jgi:undecaprenyl-diphosphatase
MGGATFTCSTSLVGAIVLPRPYSIVCLQALIALILSHIPVYFIKHIFRRERPYMKLEGVTTVERPLRDPSFPSGHTTAIFAYLTPWLFAEPFWLTLPLFLLFSISVAWSRMHLGLHYPSDVVVGGTIGFLTALVVVSWWDKFMSNPVMQWIAQNI